MQKTSIEWCDFSANPLKYRRPNGSVIWACVKVSPGCAHCYAAEIAERYERGGDFTAESMATLTPFLDDKELHKMRTAKQVDGKLVAGSRCFVGDMTDIFGEWVPEDLLNTLYSTVFEVRQDVTWQILTKRAERMHDYLNWRYHARIPARNIHHGVSVENEPFAKIRIPLLLATRSAVRFVSYEPALGPVPFRALPMGERLTLDALTGCYSTWSEFAGGLGNVTDNIFDGLVRLPPRLPGLDWVIVGGESGPGSRPFDLAWAGAVVRDCHDAHVPCFVKQLGAMPMQGPEPLALESKKGNDLAEWPEHLIVREFPRVHAQ